MNKTPYSVLMSVYFRENPEFFEQSLSSIWNQTVQPDEIVLVCDGPLTEKLDEVIARWHSQCGGVLKTVRLEKNAGLGAALNEGLKHCSHELVARMDTDDIARPDRIERQLVVFENRPDIAVCSGTVEEFDQSPDQVITVRSLPQEPDQIRKFCRKRNPFNHPCVMYRKSAVLKAGGYQPFHLLEDYWLWVRMISNGERGCNLQAPLLWMRAGAGMYKRRAGWKYVRSQAALFMKMRGLNLISSMEMLQSIALRSVSSLSPNWLRQKAFSVFLRKPAAA